MAEFFQASEVLKIAIQIEDNGEIFYRLVAEKTNEVQLKKIFDFLADEDVRHHKIFADMLLKVEEYTPSESYPGEHQAYLNVHADECIFTKEKAGEVMAQKIKSSREAIKLGIKMEIDSILYYLGMKDFVSKGQAEIIDKIIAEEHSHYLKLLNIKKNMRK